MGTRYAGVYCVWPNGLPFKGATSAYLAGALNRAAAQSCTPLSSPWSSTPTESPPTTLQFICALTLYTLHCFIALGQITVLRWLDRCHSIDLALVVVGWASFWCMCRTSKWCRNCCGRGRSWHGDPVVKSKRDH